MPEPGRRRARVNLTLDPDLSEWGKKYAKARFGKSLSRFLERLLRSEQARAKDRLRKAGALTPFERHFKIERESRAIDRLALD